MSIASSQKSKPLSTGYVAELKPDRRLRLLVMGGGWLLLLLGSVLLLHLDLSPALRTLLLVIWLADSGRELYRFGCSQAAVAAVTFDGNGTCYARDRIGERQVLTLQAGSLLLRRFAWLRFRRDDGLAYTGLFHCGSGASAAWRRLQVIWRWGDRNARLGNDK